MIMSYTFCIMMPVQDHRASLDYLKVPEGRPAMRECRLLLRRSIFSPLCWALLRCTWSKGICHQGSEPFVLFVGQVLGRIVRA